MWIPVWILYVFILVFRRWGSREWAVCWYSYLKNTFNKLLATNSGTHIFFILIFHPYMLNKYNCFHLLDWRRIFQDEPLELPAPIDKLLSDYANRYHEIKTPRKLLWKKNLGTVKVWFMFCFDYQRKQILKNVISLKRFGWISVGVAIWRQDYAVHSFPHTCSHYHAISRKENVTFVNQPFWIISSSNVTKIMYIFQLDLYRSCCNHWNTHWPIKPKSKLLDKQGTFCGCSLMLEVYKPFVWRNSYLIKFCELREFWESQMPMCLHLLSPWLILERTKARRFWRVMKRVKDR